MSEEVQPTASAEDSGQAVAAPDLATAEDGADAIPEAGRGAAAADSAREGRQAEEEEQEEEEQEEEEQEEEEEEKEEEEEELVVEEEEGDAQVKNVGGVKEEAGQIAEHEPDEEVSDEEVIAVKKKRKRMRASDFADDIAEDEDDPDAPIHDNDEDEDDEDLDDYLDEDEADLKQETKRRRMDRRDNVEEFSDDDAMHAAFDQERDQEQIERITQRVEQRFGQEGAEYDAYKSRTTAASTVSRTQLLPSVRDPKLFLVKCDPGMEETMVLALMMKFIRRMNHPDTSQRLYIHCAFTAPSSKGYVYVEADKEDHVKRAIQGLRALKSWRCSLVPISEMRDAVEVAPAISGGQVKVGQWVRLKRGLYKGDLAQIVGLEDQNTLATLKIVPRLNFNQLKWERDNPNTPKSVWKQQNAGAAKTRPLPKHFNKVEVQDITSTSIFSHQGSGSDPFSTFYFFKNNKYKFGYLFKRMNVANVDVAEPNATETELARFEVIVMDEDDDDEEASYHAQQMPALATKASSPSDQAFVAGDRVRVISSDLRGVLGRVTKTVKDVVTIIPDHKELSGVLTFKPEELSKYFRVGDHVKCVQGKYKGETGLIIEVQEAKGSALVYSDLGNRTLLLELRYIIETAEVSTGMSKMGEYELHDLVEVGRNQVGIIVRIESHQMQVLLQGDVPQAVRLNEIVRKIRGRYNVALDNLGNQVGIQDIVEVMVGKYKGTKGTITNLFRNNLFLHSRTVQINTGIFGVAAKNTRLLSGRTGRSKNFIASSPQVFGDNTGMVKQERPSRGRGFQADPLKDKIVTIRKGTWKGYTGLCVSTTETTVRVELQSAFKTVTVAKGDVKLKVHRGREAPSSSYSGRMFAETPLIGGGMTPAPAFDEGGRTPAPHSMFDASRTPARDEYGGRTPGDDFGMTPGRDVWTATTPRHVPQEYNPDDEYDVQREEMKKYQASQSSASGAAGLPLNLLVRFDGRKFKINAPLASGKYEVKDVDSGAVQNVDADSLTVVRLSELEGEVKEGKKVWIDPEAKDVNDEEKKEFNTGVIVGVDAKQGEAVISIEQNNKIVIVKLKLLGLIDDPES